MRPLFSFSENIQKNLYEASYYIERNISTFIIYRSSHFKTARTACRIEALANVRQNQKDLLDLLRSPIRPKFG